MANIVKRTEERDLTALSNEELRAEIARGLNMTAAGLAHAAVYWREAERRGENLEDLRDGLGRWMPKIIAGLLAAEAVVAFAGRAIILQGLEGVPLEEQRRLAAGEAVRVIDPATRDGVVEMPLIRVPSPVVRIVLGDGEVRSPEAQRLAFRPRLKRRQKEESGYRYRPRYDPQAGTVTVGKMTVQMADLLHELSAAAGPDRPPAADVQDDYLTVKVRLNKEEHARFLAVCRKAELPEWEMARKALRAFGLI